MNRVKGHLGKSIDRKPDNASRSYTVPLPTTFCWVRYIETRLQQFEAAQRAESEELYENAIVGKLALNM